MMKLFLYDNYKDIYPDKRNSELTDSLILKALADNGMNVDKITVVRDEKNKPMISGDGIHNVHVSCSHSAGTFACVVSDVNCGLDIQEKRDVSILQIAARYFTDEEQKYVDEHGIDGFYRIWTRREAYAKFTGTGMKQVMSKICVLGREDVTFEDTILENGMYCSICY